MVHFCLDRASAVPFYRQIMDAILAGVSTGSVLPGEKLPTIRDLAVRLEVNPNTVVKAYSQLQLLGVLDTQQGSGVFVSAPGPDAVPPDEKRRRTDDLCRDFVGRAQLLGVGLDDLLRALDRMRRRARPAAT